MNKERCIIFGGGGFVGSHLTEKLIRKGYLVIVFSRRTKEDYKNLSSVNEKINFVKGNFSNVKLIRKTIEPGDTVFDLIGFSVPSSSMKSPLDEIKHHIFSHSQFIEVASIKKVKKIVFTSSGGGVYGEKQKLPISEEEKTQPISPHAISKISIEYFLNYYGNIYNIPHIIYRIGNVYGPRQIPKKGFGVVPTLFSHVLENKPPTLFDHGKMIRDYIYIDDVIDAISRSFHKETRHHVYNIGSGKGVSLRTLWKHIRKITKTELRPIFKPKRPVDLDSVVLDVSRFKKEFSWNPKTDLERGLKRTWLNFKNNTEWKRF